jgi:hypothetical protein
MKNKEPRKISLTFFFRIFLPFYTAFQSSTEKEKGKTGTVLGRFQPRRPKSRGKRARARALAVLRKGPRLTDQSEVGSITITLSR